MLTVDIAYDVASRLLRIVNISTGQDNVLIGTTGDDLSTMIRCSFDGDISGYDTIWAEFDVRVPKDVKKKEYFHPAVQFSPERTLLIPSHVLSNTIRGDLPMQIALENSESGLRTVSVNKLLFKVAEAIDADHTVYNALVPTPETTTGNLFHTAVGDGINTTFNIVHNLGTPYINLFCYANTSFKPDIQVAWERASDNEVSVTFSEPPELNEYTVAIYIPGSSDVISINGYTGYITQDELFDAAGFDRVILSDQDAIVERDEVPGITVSYDD